ncbi:MAG: hypothetical protein ACOCVM_02960 [Desulfovibrionaceae bacterium]
MTPDGAPSPDSAPGLLAVDVGLVTGLALFSRSGRLLWARSQHLGGRSQLKRRARGLLRELPGLRLVVLEGGGELAEVWSREAARLGIESWTIPAEAWRKDMLLPRERTSGATSKAWALRKAKEVIAGMEGKKPASLRTDAAEAVLVGVWAVGRSSKL